MKLQEFMTRTGICGSEEPVHSLLLHHVRLWALEPVSSHLWASASSSVKLVGLDNHYSSFQVSHSMEQIILRT